MPMRILHRISDSRIGPSLLLYPLWVVTAGLSLLIVLVGRDAWMVLMALFSVKPRWAIFCDKCLLLVSGVLLLAVVVWSEHYLRACPKTTPYVDN